MPIGRQFIQIQVHTWYEGDPGQDGGPNKKRVVNEIYQLPDLIDKLPSYINALANGITRNLLRSWPPNDAEMMASIQILPADNAQVTAAVEQHQSLESSIILEPVFPTQVEDSDLEPRMLICPLPEPQHIESTRQKCLKVEADENSAERATERGTMMPKQSAMQTSQPGVYVVLREDALEKAKRHAEENQPCETCGVLLGQFISQNGNLFVVVTAIVRALQAIGRRASVEFTPEAWAEIWRRIDADPEYSDEKIWAVVGWYHTHPGFGIFLSSMDLFIHRNYFAQPGHIALVVDPIHRDWGVFCWDRERNEVLRCSDDGLKVFGDLMLLKKLSNLDRPLMALPPSEVVKTPQPMAQTAGRDNSNEGVEATQKPVQEPTASGSSTMEEAEVTEETETAGDHSKSVVPSASGTQECARPESPNASGLDVNCL